MLWHIINLHYNVMLSQALSYIINLHYDVTFYWALLPIINLHYNVMFYWVLSLIINLHYNVMLYQVLSQIINLHYNIMLYQAHRKRRRRINKRFFTTSKILNTPRHSLNLQCGIPVLWKHTAMTVAILHMLHLRSSLMVKHTTALNSID